MTAPLFEAFELVALSEQLLRRLDAAVTELSKREGLVEEKAWLAVARARLASAGEGIGEDLLTRALRLPELEPLKADHARVLQGAAVDALEHLHAGITFAGGGRAPLLEALYYKLKIPVLRRCDRDEFEAFCSDFEKRLGSSYAQRMLADPAYEAARSALKRLQRAVGVWRSVFVAAPAEGAEAHGLRAELEAAARRLEIACRQARLLAQAALAPLKDLPEAAALLVPKTKRRGGRSSEDEDTHPILEQDPPDPAAPTSEEAAELAASRASGESGGEERAAPSASRVES